MTIARADWQRILIACTVAVGTAAKWAEAFEQQAQPEQFSAGMDDILQWLPQILHESALLEKTQENLNYSAERLMAVWPSRFPTMAVAKQFEHRPEALANFVYGGRMGNTFPGDGWHFRGRCPIELTGREAYEHVGDLIGQDLHINPDLALGPIFGLQIARAWWEDRIPDSMLSDQVKVRRKVNGGTEGLQHCEQLHALVLKAFA